MENNTGLVFAVRDIPDVLEWEKAFKKRSEPFGSVLEFKKKRSGVEITVQEFFFS